MELGTAKQKGVTLIELVVVLAVFTIIVSISFGIFISIVQHQRRILTEQELLNQTTYVLEYISRGLRTAVNDTAGNCLTSQGVQYPGYVYLLTHYDAQGGFYQGIKFISGNNNACEEFFLDTDGVLKEIKNSGQAQNVLSDNFNIVQARFVINGNKALQGASFSDVIQPRVTILLNIEFGTAQGIQRKIVQTTVSARNLNAP